MQCSIKEICQIEDLMYWIPRVFGNQLDRRIFYVNSIYLVVVVRKGGQIYIFFLLFFLLSFLSLVCVFLYSIIIEEQQSINSCSHCYLSFFSQLYLTRPSKFNQLKQNSWLSCATFHHHIHLTAYIDVFLSKVVLIRRNFPSISYVEQQMREKGEINELSSPVLFLFLMTKFLFISSQPIVYYLLSYFLLSSYHTMYSSSSPDYISIPIPYHLLFIYHFLIHYFAFCV